MKHLIQRLKERFDKHPEEDQVIETIEGIMDEREERGDNVLVEPDELLLLKNLFKLRDIRAGQVMIPRIDIVGIPATASLSEVKDVIIREKFTRMPVYDKTLDNIIGVIHVKDLLYKLFEVGHEATVREVMTHTVLFVPESIRLLNLLRDMQTKRTQMAVVVDEYGGTAGVITLEDLLEEIVGEIEDEHDALDAPLVLRLVKVGSWEADARVSLEDLEKTIGPFVTDMDRAAGIDTVGGLVFHLAGRLPAVGETVRHPSGLRFQVVQVDSRCIRKVKITRPTPRKTRVEPVKKKKKVHKTE